MKDRWQKKTRQHFSPSQLVGKIKKKKRRKKRLFDRHRWLLVWMSSGPVLEKSLNKFLVIKSLLTKLHEQFNDDD